MSTFEREYGEGAAARAPPRTPPPEVDEQDREAIEEDAEGRRDRGIISLLQSLTMQVAQMQQAQSQVASQHQAEFNQLLTRVGDIAHAQEEFSQGFVDLAEDVDERALSFARERPASASVSTWRRQPNLRRSGSAVERARILDARRPLGHRVRQNCSSWRIQPSRQLPRRHPPNWCPTTHQPGIPRIPPQSLHKWVPALRTVPPALPLHHRIDSISLLRSTMFAWAQRFTP